MGRGSRGSKLNAAATRDDGPPLDQKAKRRRNNGRKQPSGWRNGISIGLLALAVAVLVGGPLGNALQNVGLGLAALIVLASIAIAILADILAIAATAGREEPFNAMASNKVAGAREALTIVRNAEKVNSIFSDVIGDICGTISGVAATPIILSVHALYPGLPLSVITMAVLGLVAFLTVGGKAAEKGFAVKASTSVLLFVGKIVHYSTRWRYLRRRSRSSKSRPSKVELASKGRGNAGGKN